MNNRMEPRVRRGDIFYADLGNTVGSEQRGARPVLIIQNDLGNRYSPTVIVAALTSKVNKKHLPTHVEVGIECGLREKSIIMFEKITTIDRQRLRDYVGTVSDAKIAEINTAIKVSMGLEVAP